MQATLLKRLQDADANVRVAAVNVAAADREVLSRMEQSLIDLLTIADEGPARQAAFLLQRLGPRAVNPLLNALRDEHSRIEPIAEALALIGQPATERLQAALADPEPRIRQGAALALGQIRPLPPGTVARLAAGLKDENQSVQAAFLTSIRGLGARAQEAVPAVRGILKHPSPEIRMQVVDILFEAAPRDAALLSELGSLLDDPDLLVQRHAIDTLRATGPFAQSVMPRVIEKLSSEDREVRLAAADFIRSYGRASAEAVPHLIEQLDQPDEAWRIKILTTLGGLGSTAQAAVPRLAELAEVDSAALRLAAVEALGNLQLSPEEIRPHVLNALRDKDAEVRSQATRIIRRFGRRGMLFVPDLLPLLADEQIADSISRLLERMEGYTPDGDDLPRLVQLLDHHDVPVQIPHLLDVLKSLPDSPELRQFTDSRKYIGQLMVEINSFSYKRGIPLDLSENGGGFVFDCRAIHNPGRYEQYKKLTGLDPEVQEFLSQNGEAYEFVYNAYHLIEPSIKNYIDRKFTNLMINFGCTGGQHRSVFCAEKMKDILENAFGENIDITLKHREMELKKLGL
jgi:HEAT repeat protein